jgi:hypothetical protein
MSSLGMLYLAMASVLILALPRSYALLPLVLAPAYTPTTEVLAIGGANFTIPRLLIALGFMRVVVRGEALGGRWERVDSLVLAWAAVLMATAAFHTPDAWMYRLGMVWTELGGYFLARRLLQDHADIRKLLQALAWLLIPLALMLVYEKATATNLFSAFNGVSAAATIREGKVRAAGPFAHPILAGTAGAMLFGFGMTLWSISRKQASVVCVAGAAAVYASASSGPMLMLVSIIIGQWLFALRHQMRSLQAGVLLCLVALDVVMNDPVYFLMAKVDLAGGSQGYFRAQLIRSSIEHFSEWWFAGTDMTRHWMQTGLKVTTRHTDITNHFLWMGVLGGVLLIALFVWILAAAFAVVGRTMRDESRTDRELAVTWGLGCVLAGLTANFLSVAMFDQSIVSFWLVVAMVATAATVRRTTPMARPQAATSRPGPTRFPWSTTP